MDKFSIRQATHSDLKYKLDLFGRCALIRPTGFGKTYELTHIAGEYKNVLYLYPADVIKDTVLSRYAEEYDVDPETIQTVEAFKNTSGVTLMSYMKLIRLSNEELESLTVDLLIMDEVHRVGGKVTLEAVRNLLSYHPDCKVIGATATPNRSDGLDVIDELFDNVTVFPYTLHDAFQDGLLCKPYYCFCTYDIVNQVKRDLKKAALTAGEDLSNLRVKEVLDSRIIEISNMFEMDKIISNVCDEAGVDTSYMKFIVFFNGIDHISEKEQHVIKWFQDAFPEHIINDPLIISSEDSEKKKNVSKLDSLVPCRNHVDLIFCINMLNMGYHVDNITGVMMYRGTISDIVYIQQLGRALSSGQSTSCVVFDVVDNLHRKAAFDVASKYSSRMSAEAYSESVNNQSVNTLTDETAHSPAGTSCTMASDIEYNSSWWKDCNRIFPEDLHPVSYIATYKELIAKTVAEPMTQRCIEAVEAHFHRWCVANNIEYPVTDAQLKSLYNSSREEFLSTFDEILKANKLNYPMGDASQLLSIGKKRGTGVPLSVFAKWKNVSVGSILELLGVA